MSIMRPFREDYRTNVPMLRGIVKWMNMIGHVLNNIHFASGDTARVIATPSGIRFVLPNGLGEGGDVVGTNNSAFIAEARFEAGEEGEGPLMEVKMLGGTVQGVFGRLNSIKTTYWTTDPDGVQLFPEAADGDESDSGSGSESGSGSGKAKNIEVIVGEEMEDGEHFWLEYDANAEPEDEEEGEESDSDSGSDEDEPGRWVLKHGKRWPRSATTTSADKVLYFTTVPLFYVSRYVTDQNVVQQHFGSVYVPTATNVVPIQLTPTNDDEDSDSGSGSGSGE